MIPLDPVGYSVNQNTDAPALPSRSRGGMDVVVAPITDEQAFAQAVEQRAREIAGANYKRRGALPARFWRAAIVEFATMGEREEAAA